MKLTKAQQRCFARAPSRTYDLDGLLSGHGVIGKNQQVTLLVGRKTGLSYGRKKEGQKLTKAEVKSVINNLRAKQIGKKKVGISIVEQDGIYKGQPEKSLQAKIIFDGSDGTLKKFEQNIVDLAQEAAGLLAQREVIILWETQGKNGEVSSASPKDAPDPTSKGFCKWVKKHSKNARTKKEDDCY